MELAASEAKKIWHTKVIKTKFIPVVVIDGFVSGGKSLVLILSVHSWSAWRLEDHVISTSASRRLLPTLIKWTSKI